LSNHPLCLALQVLASASLQPRFAEIYNHLFVFLSIKRDQWHVVIKFKLKGDSTRFNALLLSKVLDPICGKTKIKVFSSSIQIHLPCRED
jgi:hypothetical protein